METEMIDRVRLKLTVELRACRWPGPSVLLMISFRCIVSAVMVVLDRDGLSASQRMSAHDPSKWYGMLSRAW
jgi:hypothetical protein